MPAPTPTSVYQIKVTLNDSKPPVWRRVLVPDTTTLSKLHNILQVVMGWEDYHLHMFTINDQIYGDPEEDETGEIGTKNETHFRLNQFVGGVGVKFRYEYDFGDSWEHDLLIEKITRSSDHQITNEPRTSHPPRLRHPPAPCRRGLCQRPPERLCLR